MMSAPSLIRSKQSIVLDLPPSCIEFCPAHPCYFLVGTYNLLREEEKEASPSQQEQGEGEGEDEVIEQAAKKTQNRNGTVLVFKLDGNELEQVQTVDRPSAILDLHFQATVGRQDACGAVSSTGSLYLFKLSPETSSSEPLFHTSTLRVPSIGEDVLFLSFAWHPTDPDLVAITTSTHEVYVLKLNSTHTGFVAGFKPLITHDLEAWTVAFSPPSMPVNQGLTDQAPIFTTVYSGGDDSTMRFLSYQLGPEDGEASVQTPYAAVKVPGHTAGVTAILPLDISLNDGSKVVVTGSYDDNIRAFGVQPLHETYGMRRARLLADENLEGGVWRLKLIDTGIDGGGEQAMRWRVRLLASCMHAGARVVEISGTGEGACEVKILGRFVEHASMNYGSDFHVDTRRGSSLLSCVSTSFYDKLLCLWEYELGP